MQEYKRGATQDQFFKRGLTGLNPEFISETVCITKVKELSLPYYLPIAGERIISYIPCLNASALCEMEIAYSRYSTPSLPLLPAPLWSGVVIPDRCKGQIELFGI